MKRLLLLAAFAACFLAACQRNVETDNYDVLNFSDDTTQASELVADANEDLNKIKVLYKRNETQLDDLKSAIGDKNAEKVHQIAENLVYIINDGVSLGQHALGKIESAEALNINEDFKEYLNLKAQSLQKQLDAFEHRRQAALLLRDSFGTKDAAAIEKARSEFREQEETAQKIFAEAQEFSEKANELAKNAANKTVN